MVQLAVLSIALHHVTVQFDHMSKQKFVKSRFIVMKNFLCLQKAVSTNPSICCDYS